MSGRHHRLPHDPADSELLEADPLCDLQHPPKSSTTISRPIATVLSDPIADRQLRKTIKHIENCSLTVNSNKQQSLQNLIPPAPPPPTQLPPSVLGGGGGSVRSSSSRHSSPCLRTTTSTTNNNNHTTVGSQASGIPPPAVLVASRLSSPESTSQASSNTVARSGRQKLTSSRSISSSSDCYRAHDMSEKLL